MSDPVFTARLADELPVAIQVLDGEGRPVYANRRFEALLGDGEADPVVRRLFEQVSQTRRPHLEEGLCVTGPDGQRRHLRAEARPVLDADGELTQVALAFADVTAERLARERASSVVDELRFVLANMSDFVYRHDPEGNFYYMSPAVEAITGYTRDEWMSHYTTYLTDNPLNEKVVHLTEAALRTGEKQPTYMVELWHKQGHRITVEVNERPFFTKDGAVAGMVGVGRDVTERHLATAEIERLNKSLQDKNRDLERVIYVASHDLRTPLVGIEGFASELSDMLRLLRERLGDEVDPEALALLTEDLPDSAAHVQRGAQRMDRLLAGLLELSRLGRADVGSETVDMNALLERVAESFTYQLREAKADLHLGTLPPCRGDALKLERMFTNLVSNALKFLVPSRSGRVGVTGEVVGSQVRYRVSDNGRGIPRDLKARVFDAFHRIDPMGPAGEGLGLTIAQRIAERLDGTMGIESGARGTTVWVELPAS